MKADVNGSKYEINLIDRCVAPCDGNLSPHSIRKSRVQRERNDKLATFPKSDRPPPLIIAVIGAFETTAPLINLETRDHAINFVLQ